MNRRMNDTQQVLEREWRKAQLAAVCGALWDCFWICVAVGGLLWLEAIFTKGAK